MLKHARLAANRSRGAITLVALAAAFGLLLFAGVGAAEPLYPAGASSNPSFFSGDKVYFTEAFKDGSGAIVTWNTHTGQRSEVRFRCPSSLDNLYFNQVAVPAEQSFAAGPLFSADGKNLYALFFVSNTYANAYWEPPEPWDDDIGAYTTAPSDPTETTCYTVWQDYEAWLARWLQDNPTLTTANTMGPAAAVIESTDGGRSWHPLPLPPDSPFMGADAIVDGEALELVPVPGGVAYGSQSHGWSIWNRQTQLWSAYQQQGSDLGMTWAYETGDVLAPSPGPLPPRFFPTTYRYLPDGTLWTYATRGTASQTTDSMVVLSRGGRQLRRVNVRVSVPVATPSGMYACPSMRVPPTRSIDEMLSSPDGRVYWGLTTHSEWIVCAGHRTFAELNAVLVRSTDSGARWQTFPTAPRADWLEAVDGDAVIVAFSTCENGAGANMARFDGRRWRSLGCEPVRTGENPGDSLNVW